jgi:glycosyltransferase involved in cell wall biosynthesis
MLLTPSIQPQLSVIVASSRPQWLANCLYQYQSQSLGGLRVELIVVVEGEERDFAPVLHLHKPDQVIYKRVQGFWGVFAKDTGLKAARGDYVCFWDDDNIYYPHSLATLYAAALGSDIGIVRTGFMGTWFKEIPRKHTIEFGNIDTMCLCISRKLAVKVKWSDHLDKGTDFAYVQKLMEFGPMVRWVDISIGEKLLEDMKQC